MEITFKDISLQLQQDLQHYHMASIKYYSAANAIAESRVDATLRDSVLNIGKNFITIYTNNNRLEIDPNSFVSLEVR